ncbi:hypothetical protein J2S49_000888 [Arcanobacterium wilhelmae]|uniref:FHA domain-containing protein n=1 Tax=Arcanobacterium wilhelmae TaxID=1803177 RepID=A0ABT9NAR0_9ACTO|nr:FHA domain-containing protein [Arcanobacterium wilhelmae]MDP9800812.1 hypothetical protein [Arcanobacterium wilhelmae]
MRARWYEGVYLAAVAPAGALLIATDVDVTEFYHALAGGASFNRVLDLLRRRWSSTVMPAFALVVHEGNDVRVAVRGGITVMHAGEVVRASRHVALWAEDRLAVGSFTLGSPTQRAFPVNSGVVPAGAIDIDFTLTPTIRVDFDVPTSDNLAMTLDPEAAEELVDEFEEYRAKKEEPVRARRAPTSAEADSVHKAHEGQVLAARCEFGHPNSPTSVYCRICGATVGEETEWIDPPVLGRLITNTGTSVPVYRDIVIGRDPVRQAGQHPTLLPVTSPNKQVSRTHAAVIVTGWAMRVIDLESGNGTYLLRPGEQPARVSTTTATRLLDGDVLDLGDGVRIEVGIQ